MTGILNVNKPAGISSARVVARVKRLLPRGVKIGHAGTLDPFATGVLLLLVGSSTRLCERLMDEAKQYETTVKFGATTATDDPESPEQIVVGVEPPAEDRVRRALPQFVGEILQCPPAFSALKVGGRRAYDLARQGKPVELHPRRVRVYGIELISYDWPLAKLRVDCGRGVYIRAIARDLGEALGTGAHLTQLCRTRVGSFDLTSAVDIDRLQSEGVVAHLRVLPIEGTR